MRDSELLQMVGITIRKIRESRGYSQEAFARDAGIDRAYYGRIERGEANITLKGLFRIARQLQTSPSEFLIYVEEEDLDPANDIHLGP